MITVDDLTPPYLLIHHRKCASKEKTAIGVMHKMHCAVSNQICLENILQYVSHSS